MNITSTKTIKLLLCILSLLFFSNSTVYASECGILKFQSNRSSGINIDKNECSKLPNISSGSIVNLSSKGRLWLKSNSENEKKPDFQLICQNRTNETIQLEFSDTKSPWLNQSKLNNCSDWANNKLTCDGNNNQKKGLYCVMSIAKSSKGKSTKVVRTTSVKMRSLSTFDTPKKTNNNIDKKHIIATINPDLKLCKDLNEQSEKINLTWSVENQQINVLSRKIKNSSLSDCVNTIISSFSYPQFSEKTTFESTF